MMDVVELDSEVGGVSCLSDFILFGVTEPAWFNASDDFEVVFFPLLGFSAFFCFFFFSIRLILFGMATFFFVALLFVSLFNFTISFARSFLLSQTFSFGFEHLLDSDFDLVFDFTMFNFMTLIKIFDPLLLYQ